MNRKRLEERNISMLRVRLPLHLVNRLEGVAVTNKSTKSQEVRKALEKALPAL
jgi:predicted DNA-binding protein